MVSLAKVLQSKLPSANKFKASAILISRQIKIDREKKGLPVFNGGLGENPLPAPVSLQESLKRHSGIKGYTDTAGVAQFRHSVKKVYFPEKVRESDMRIIVGNGSKPLLYLVQLTFARLNDHLSNPKTENLDKNFLLIHLLPAWTTYMEQMKLILNPKVHKTGTFGDNFAENSYLFGSPNYLAVEPDFSGVNEDDLIMTWPKILASQLERQLKKHLKKHASTLGTSPNMLVLLNNPNNPTGCMYNKKELQDFADVFRKYGIICLADDIYSGLVHESYCRSLDHFGGSIAQYYPEGTIQSNSLSKSWGCGGYRMGWLIFPPLRNQKPNSSLDILVNDVYDLSSILAGSLYSFPSTFLQHVASDALNMSGTQLVPVMQSDPKKKDDVTNDITSQLVFQRKMFEDIANYCRGRFNEMGLKYTDSKAAWYFMVDFEPKYGKKLKSRSIYTSSQLVRSLVEQVGFISVSVEHFGIRSEQKNFILRYSYVEIKDIRGVATDGRKGQYDFSKIKEGLNVLQKWLEAL